MPGAESDANAIRAAAAVEIFLIQNYLTEKVELKPELAGRHDTDLVNVVLREMLKHHAHVEVVLHRGPIQPHVQFSAQCLGLGPENIVVNSHVKNIYESISRYLFRSVAERSVANFTSVVSKDFE